MVKKNVIGIVVVLLVFAGFYSGYMLGKNSASPGTGMRTEMRRGGRSSSSTPSSSKDGSEASRNAPGIEAPGGSHAENGKKGTEDASVMANAAWAEPLKKSEKSVPPETRLPEDTPQEARPPQKERDPGAIQTFYGTVAPYAEANVQSEQGGAIVALHGKEGDVVKKGQLLVRFDDRDKQLQLRQAIASKNSALQQANQAESNFQTIQADVKRYQKLFEGGFISKQQLENLHNQLASAGASFQSARESVTQSEVQIEIIENALKDFQVNAPIDGIIERKNYNQSELYQGGGVLYHLIDIEQVYIEVEVPETYLKQVREGGRVDVGFDAVGEQRFSGVLETILPSGATDNRNFTVKVLVQNPDRSIKPGMFARVEMAVDAESL